MLGLALGCNVTASLGGGEASTGAAVDAHSSGGEIDQATSSSSTAARGTGGFDSTSGSSSGVVSTESSGSTADPSSSSTSIDEGDLCRAEPDGTCLACIQSSCCEALLACAESPGCACLLGCLEFAPDFLSCIGIPACQGGIGTQPLAVCAGFECTQPCGFPGPPDADPSFPLHRRDR